MGEAAACSAFFVQDHFFNVYSKWEHSTQCLTSASLHFRMIYGNTSDMRHLNVQYVYKCVCVGVNPALAPVLGLHLQAGHEGPRARGLSGGHPFPKPRGPRGSARGTGPGRVWWDLLLFVAGDAHQRPFSFAGLGCTIINNFHWKKTTSWIVILRWCEGWALWMIWCLMGGF